MFSQSRSSGRSGRHNFGRPKKEKNSKKLHVRTWVILNKKKHKHHEDGVMMSGDSPPPLCRVSVPPSPGFDIPDDVRPGKTSPSSTTSKTLRSSDTEAIEEAVPIVEKTLPAPEPKPKVEKNGSHYDTPDGKKTVDYDNEDNSCVIKCLSFTQQCCDCTIL